MEIELVQEKNLNMDTMFVNMGPQHPSTHGVLRLAIHMEGEVITHAEPDVGYLHRGIEKLFENRTWTQGLVLTDRLDYLSSMHNNLGYCLAVEKLMGIEVPPKAQYIRALVSELNRIASHLIFFGTYAVDMGAFTPLLHAFREREMLMDIFEMLCGARLIYTYMRIGGVANDLPEGWSTKCREFTGFFPKRLDEYNTLLTFNPIFMDRTSGIGIISKEEALDWGLSGPVLRATGINYDVRKFEPYSFYDKLEFEIPLGKTGSTWDRYYCRMREMAQSTRIIDECLDALSKTDMPPETITKGVPKILKPPKGQAYAHVEASRGDLGFYAVSENELSPYRVHIKSPTFINTAILQKILVGAKIADVVAILGSFDIVLGEMDR